MRKFVFGFILLVCFSVSAQENKESFIAFSEQGAFQTIIHQDGFFSVNRFQFSDGTKIKDRKELNEVLYNVPDAKVLSRKAGFWRGMTWLSIAGAVGFSVASACVEDANSYVADNLAVAGATCVYLLFLFPVFEYSYRNRAVDKYNQFVLNN